MPRRGENIFKRKDGRWEARYIHHYENGKAKYRYLYASTYAEVKLKRVKEMSIDYDRGSHRIKHSVTMEELSKAWLCDIRIAVKESTYTRYHRIVTKYIVPRLGHEPVIKLDAYRINRFSEDLLINGGLNRNPLSSKTVIDLLCVIKSIYKFGTIHGYPCPRLDGVRYPQRNGKQIRILSQDNRIVLEKKLLNSDDITSLGILFSMFMGLRIGELCGLKWKDVDFDNSTVRICRTVERIADLNPLTSKKTKVILCEPKTKNAIRTIPIPSFFEEHIRKFRQEDEIYVVSGNKTYIEPHYFYIKYKKYLKEHDIDNYTFHALRHTFATRCVEFGFDAKSLSEILGHASVTTTMMFYVHPTLEQKRIQMERLTPIIY